MLKQLIIALALILFGSTGSYAQSESDLATQGLRGKIKSVEIYSLYYQPETGWSKRRLWTAETFNPNGNTLERQVFRDERIISKVIYLYDERGRKIGDKSYSGSTGRLEETPTLTELALNDSGKTAELKVYYSGAATAEVRHIFKYDERGNLLETDYGLAGKSVMTYDAQNNRTSRLNSNLSGIVYNKSFAEYNKHRIIKSTIYEAEELRYEQKFKYDATHRLIEVETTEFNRPPNMFSSHAPEPGKLIYNYDEQNKIRWTTKYSLTGEPEPNSTSIYNERDEQIGYYCATGELQTCRTVIEYKTDSRGNTIMKTYYDRQSSGALLKPRAAEEKVITYY